MSRQIDLEDIQPEDFQHILQRPWLIEEAEQNGFSVPQALYNLRDGLEDPNELEGSDTHSAGSVAGVVTGATLDDSEDEDGDDYDVWPKGALVDELESRGLTKGGNVAELIARLRKSDVEAEAENDLDDDDEDEDEDEE